MMAAKLKVAVLDDYQQVAMRMADWSVLDKRCEITIFHDHVVAQADVLERLKPFDVVCVMRERTPLTRDIINALPKLKLIVSTGARNASIDIIAAEEKGIAIRHTSYIENGAPELSWAILMALARNLPKEVNNVRTGGWQTTVGIDLKGKKLGLIGLGRIGTKMAVYGRAFDMDVMAWSQNLTAEKAEAAGAKRVSKEQLFREADFISIHLILSARSRGIITADDLALMKPTAFFINTSRGPLVDEAALVKILTEHKIAGAALDVYGQEPLPAAHPFRKLDNVLATPHIGYVTEATYQVFYNDTVAAIKEWLQKAG